MPWSLLPHRHRIHSCHSLMMSEGGMLAGVMLPVCFLVSHLLTIHARKLLLSLAHKFKGGKVSRGSATFWAAYHMDVFWKVFVFLQFTRHRRHMLPESDKHPPFHHKARLHLRHLVSHHQPQANGYSVRATVGGSDSNGKPRKNVSFADTKCVDFDGKPFAWSSVHRWPSSSQFPLSCTVSFAKMCPSEPGAKGLEGGPPPSPVMHFDEVQV